ncbi:MAG: type III-B CRISPR-associated protein Cas10/Cmr2, partial [Halothiobacillus sp.]|nr:type III-B CRISPR-associated protein Cas10/Cmr2 [Halothiobacillus sp.]
TYTPPDEPGVKCSMMDGWQERSGEVSPKREKMNVFWNAVSNNGKTGIQSDLAENEALCAIAFVKRRFSRYFANVDFTMPQGWRLKGWSVPSGVPSVAYMAAVPWLEIALGHANPGDLKAFHDAAELTDREYGEWETNIRCLQDSSRADDFKRLRSLDGNVFFKSQLENKNVFPDQKLAKKTLDALSQVNQSADLDPVSPFYAILLMDGDSLGSHMSDLAKQQKIAEGLSKFTQSVPDIVDDWNGFLIYAGGDDVLAILPMEDAIPCATRLRSLYMECFKGSGIPTTLSGAIEFAHIKMPLTKVLKDAHGLLDDVAKDGRGRDALAIRVWKPGGSKIEWAQPWEIALIPGKDKTYVEQIAEQFRYGSEEPTQFSNKFFYKIAERFEFLNPKKEGGTSPVLSESQALDLLAMEYLNSGKSKISTREQARDFIRPLLIQCRPVIRDKDESDPEKWKKGGHQLEVDGALLVRFLAQKGVE